MTAATAPATAPRTAVAAVFKRDGGGDGLRAGVFRVERVAAARAAVLRRAVFLDAGRFAAVVRLFGVRRFAVGFLAACFFALGFAGARFAFICFLATNPPCGFQPPPE